MTHSMVSFFLPVNADDSIQPPPVIGTLGKKKYIKSLELN